MSNLGFTLYFLGNYKLVLQYGDKFAPLTKDGLGAWGTLAPVSQSEVIRNERIPFIFNIPNNSTYYRCKLACAWLVAYARIK